MYYHLKYAFVVCFFAGLVGKVCKLRVLLFAGFKEYFKNNPEFNQPTKAKFSIRRDITNSLIHYRIPMSQNAPKKEPKNPLYKIS